ncbi:MAG: hypothetical protein ACTSX8_05975 [Alphaproteobacteria bacterium]
MTRFDPIEQFERIKRSLARVTETGLRPGSDLVIGDPGPLDLARVFFIECQNLKDYLKRDPRIADPMIVESFINSSPMLKLCIDIGNSFKHAGPDRKPRSGMQLARIRHAHTLRLPPNQADARVGTEIMLTFGNKEYNATEVAVECVSEWERLLKSVNML